MRVCRTCGQSKPLSEFNKQPNRNGNTTLRWHCKLCQSAKGVEWGRNNPDKVLASRVKMNYNLTLQEYRLMLSYGCEVCGQLEGLHIDHDHACCPGPRSCGKCVRGALCNRHNVALGMVHDSVEELKELITYLRSPRYRV